MTDQTSETGNRKTSLYVTEGQKQRLQEMAVVAGFTVGRGGDSQLPAFLDHLMDVYPLALEGDDPDEVWDAFLEEMGPLVEELKERMQQWDVEVSDLLSPDGGVYIEIENERRRIKPGNYAKSGWGPAEFEAVGRIMVQVVERLQGFQHDFASLAAANAFWTALVETVQTVDGQLYMRNSMGVDRFRLPNVDFEHFVTGVMDTALEEFAGEQTIAASDRAEVAEFVQKLLPDHPRSLLVQAQQAEDRADYASAITLYEQAAEAIRARRPYFFEEKDKVSRSASIRYTSEGREYMMAQRGLANALARSRDVKGAIRVCEEALKFQPSYNIEQEEMLMTLMDQRGHLNRKLRFRLDCLPPDHSLCLMALCSC